eukprot:GHVL01034309.1.p1 GENE.GHVL01034309.1~~GHVL01034309.1.p1  ORF type:complete len:1586 (+),score=311.58 GHVL01034309.1:99-4856(+)
MIYIFLFFFSCCAIRQEIGEISSKALSIGESKSLALIPKECENPLFQESVVPSGLFNWAFRILRWSNHPKLLPCANTEISLIGADPPEISKKDQELLVLWVPDMGRRFSIGSLYDVRTDQQVSGFLYDIENVRKHTKRIPAPFTEYVFSYSDDTRSKSDLMDVSVDLSLNVQSGKVTVDGSFNFLKDNKSNTQESRASMKYKLRSVKEDLDIFAPELKYWLNPQPFEDKLATHVVTGVMWGADIVATFVKTTDKTEDKSSMAADLKLAVETGSVALDLGVNFKMNNEQTKATEGLEVRMHADVTAKDKPIPTTFEEAIAYMQELPTMIQPFTDDISGYEYPPGVPVKIQLFPLNKLSDKAASLAKMLDDDALEEITETMDDLETSKQLLGDLLTIKEDGFLAWRWEVRKRLDELLAWSQTIKTELSALLPQIKKGEAEPKALDEIVKKHRASEFSKEKMEKFAEVKNDEIRNLKALVSVLFAQNVTIAYHYSDYSAPTFDSSLEHVYVLVLKGMNPEKNREESDAVRRFAFFAGNRMKMPEFKFIFIHFDTFASLFNSVVERTCILHYQQSILVDDCASAYLPPTVPTKPGTPRLEHGEHATGDSYRTPKAKYVRLNFDVAEPNKSPVLNYVIRYSWVEQIEKEDPKTKIKALKWDRKQKYLYRPNPRNTNVKVDDLVAGRKYSFEVRAVNGEGEGPWSDMSEAIQPGIPHSVVDPEGFELHDSAEPVVHLNITFPSFVETEQITVGGVPCDVTHLNKTYALCDLPTAPTSGDLVVAVLDIDGDTAAQGSFEFFDACPLATDWAIGSKSKTSSMKLASVQLFGDVTCSLSSLMDPSGAQKFDSNLPSPETTINMAAAFDEDGNTGWSGQKRDGQFELGVEWKTANRVRCIKIKQSPGDDSVPPGELYLSSYWKSRIEVEKRCGEFDSVSVKEIESLPTGPQSVHSAIDDSKCWTLYPYKISSSNPQSSLLLSHCYADESGSYPPEQSFWLTKDGIKSKPDYFEGSCWDRHPNRVMGVIDAGDLRTGNKEDMMRYCVKLGNMCDGVMCRTTEGTGCVTRRGRGLRLTSTWYMWDTYRKSPCKRCFTGGFVSHLGGLGLGQSVNVKIILDLDHALDGSAPIKIKFIAPMGDIPFQLSIGHCGSQWTQPGGFWGVGGETRGWIVGGGHFANTKCRFDQTMLSCTLWACDVGAVTLNFNELSTECCLKEAGIDAKPIEHSAGWVPMYRNAHTIAPDASGFVMEEMKAGGWSNPNVVSSNIVPNDGIIKLSFVVNEGRIDVMSPNRCSSDGCLMEYGIGYGPIDQYVTAADPSGDPQYRTGGLSPTTQFKGIENSAKCCRLCCSLAHEGCRYFTYLESTHQCFLLTTSTRRKFTFPGATSGSIQTGVIASYTPRNNYFTPSLVYSISVRVSGQSDAGTTICVNSAENIISPKKRSASNIKEGVWAHYRAPGNYWENNQWGDSSPNKRHSELTRGKPLIRVSEDALYFTPKDGIRFSAGSIPEEFTILVIARFSGHPLGRGDGTRERIFDGVNDDWSIGFTRYPGVTVAPNSVSPYDSENISLKQVDEWFEFVDDDLIMKDIDEEEEEKKK